MIHSANLPLFADIGRYNTFAETKTLMSSAQANDYLISLGSLLDRGNVESIIFKQYQIEATAFKGEFCSGDVSITTQDMDNPIADSLSCSKIYYVSTLDTQTDTTDLMVVTMIPDHNYLSEHDVSEISYLDKADYSGLILYSDIDGSFREAIYFKRGLLVPVSPLEPGDSIRDVGKVHYLAAYQSSETKAMACNRRIVSAFEETPERWYGGELEAAYCTASRTTNGGDLEDLFRTAYRMIDSDLPDPVIMGPSNDSNNQKGSCSGTNGSAKGTKKTPSTRNEKQTFTVRLTAQMISPGESCGMVTGSGTYAYGRRVHCQATANSSYVFDRWTGNLPGSGPWVDFSITRDITATAMFIKKTEQQTKRPCWNYETNIANPLAVMKIAPTDSGLLDNGVFNLNNPNRNTGKHQGIDLAAEVGTPIYAPCDGVISKTKAFVTGQPQRSSKDWPNGYTGDKDNAGNRFYLDCVLPSGEKISYGFWHLQAGTPVAVNPRTGKTFARGDEVYQGDIIGYVGRTGNAYKIKNTHLHLGVKNSSGSFVDPEPYLNGTVQRNDAGKVSQAQFQSIKCDDKSKLANYEDSYSQSPTKHLQYYD